MIIALDGIVIVKHTAVKGKAAVRATVLQHRYGTGLCPKIDQIMTEDHTILERMFDVTGPIKNVPAVLDKRRIPVGDL